MKKAEKLARRMATNYYEGLFKERYSDTRLLRNQAGPLTDDPALAAQWVREQVTEHVNAFWKSWSDESKKLLAELTRSTAKQKVPKP